MIRDVLFDALASRPDDSIVFRGATADWSAQAVRVEVERLAARLLGKHVVALLADNSPEWALTDLAALRGEPSYVWRAGQERRLQMIARWTMLENARVLDAGCGVGMYTSKFIERYTS